MGLLSRIISFLFALISVSYRQLCSCYFFFNTIHLFQKSLHFFLNIFSMLIYTWYAHNIQWHTRNVHFIYTIYCEIHICMSRTCMWSFIYRIYYTNYKSYTRYTLNYMHSTTTNYSTSAIKKSLSHTHTKKKKKRENINYNLDIYVNRQRKTIVTRKKII